jgi:hypothetical protein
MRFTYAYISYKEDVYNQYLKPCLDNIRDEVDIITKSGLKPSKFHNEVINESPNDYIIFSHEDVTFSPDILELVEEGINDNPNFGVLCVIGKDKTNANKGAVSSIYRNLEFCDPCFFVIDKKNNVNFDEKNFDGFHFGVEDYCLTLKEKLGKDTISFKIRWASDGQVRNFRHHSYTCKTVKYQWGNYQHYKHVLKKKWGHLENIKNF